MSIDCSRNTINFNKLIELGIAVPFDNYRMAAYKRTSSLASAFNTGVNLVSLNDQANSKYLFGQYPEDLDGNQIKNISFKSTHRKYTNIEDNNIGKGAVSNVDLVNNTTIQGLINDKVFLNTLPLNWDTLNFLKINEGLIFNTRLNATTLEADVTIKSHARILSVNALNGNKVQIVTSIGNDFALKEYGQYVIHFYYKAINLSKILIYLLEYTEEQKNDPNINPLYRNVGAITATSNDTMDSDWREFVMVVDRLRNNDIKYLRLGFIIGNLQLNSFENKAVIAYPTIRHDFSTGLNGIVKFMRQPNDMKLNRQTGLVKTLVNENQTEGNFIEGKDVDYYTTKFSFIRYPAQEFHKILKFEEFNRNGKLITMHPHFKELPPCMIGDITIGWKYNHWNTSFIDFDLTFTETI